jgi:hypothetical protein
MTCGPYGQKAIFYRQKRSGKVKVVRIQHGSMDIETSLFSITYKTRGNTESRGFSAGQKYKKE